MKFDLAPGASIAFFMSDRLGDMLVSMVAVHNLQQNGYQMTVFGNYAKALKNWFPATKIEPTYQFEKDENQQLLDLQQYDGLMCMFHENIPEAVHQSYKTYVLYGMPGFSGPFSMVQAMVNVCSDEEGLGLAKVAPANGCALPKQVKSRRFDKRIIIQPTSREAYKDWPRKRFLALAQRLQARGYEVEFIVAPDELEEWQVIRQHRFVLNVFNSIDEWASYLAESGWYIGNDSGGGHLASCLGLPTMILGARKKLLRRWQPGWTKGTVVLPIAVPMTMRLKHKLWKCLLSVSRAEKRFLQLVAQYRAGR